jgi:outer membrane assembly lipoprotein YfiO
MYQPPGLRFSLRFSVGLGAVLLLFYSSAALAQKPTWAYDNGRWPQVNDKAPRQISDPAIDEAQEQLAKGNTEIARKMLLAWEHTHKDSPVRDRAVFLIAQSYYNGDDRIMAFYYLDEVMDEYPESHLFASALKEQYDIGDAFLSGHKRRIFGISCLPAEDEAVEMLYRVQQRSPGSPLAERALLRTADYYYNSGQFDYAADAYAAFARSYPRSDAIPRARLRQAFSSLAQFRGVDFDATSIIDARAELVDLQKTYPKMADDENIPVFLEKIDEAFAAKLFSIAGFYERTGQPKSAAYYYQFLIETYGSSAKGEQARERLAALPLSAKGPPFPPRATGYAPETGSDINAR